MVLEFRELRYALSFERRLVRALKVSLQCRVCKPLGRRMLPFLNSGTSRSYSSFTAPGVTSACRSSSYVYLRPWLVQTGTNSVTSLISCFPRLILQEYCPVHDAVLRWCSRSLASGFILLMKYGSNSTPSSTTSRVRSPTSHGRSHSIMSSSPCFPRWSSASSTSSFRRACLTDTHSSTTSARRITSSPPRHSGSGWRTPFTTVL